MTTWANLPGWRRPFGAITGGMHPPINGQGLREALYELLGSEPQTVDVLAAAVREQWGEATDAEIGRALVVLRRSGAIVRAASGYLRREAQRRGTRASASDLLEAGWLPPKAAADRLGISEQDLRGRVQRGEIRRKEIAPGVWLYEVSR